MKKTLSKIKAAYLFNILAILLLVATIYLYDQFEETKDSIVDTNLQSQIAYTHNITDKLSKSIINSIKDENLFDKLKDNKELRIALEEHLSMFITKRYRYVYVVDKLSPEDDEFRVLLDGSEKYDKSEFEEPFIPLNTKIWEDVYLNKKPKFFKHKEGTNLWMTYLNPIVVNDKVQGLVVIDFALEDHNQIVHDLHELDETFEGIVIFFVIIFFLLVWFSYFDLQRAKEKENIQNQLKQLNDELETKIKQEIKKSRKKDQQIIQQSRLAQMGEMISMIAHQWRQPLAAISSASASIQLKAKRDRLNNEVALELSKKISDYSQHLSSTIDDFRNFFKSNKKKEKTSYKEIIDGVLNIVSESMANKNITITTQLNCKEGFESYSNELKQVVLNLIKNAEDILVEKDIKDKQILLKSYSNEGNCILEVSDNAGGIPDKIIEKVFDPYFSTKTKKDGTGLGLYMSKTIIEDHCGGKLEVSNNADGAVFTITLNKTI
jgi:signal transduction histidine kinase